MSLGAGREDFFQSGNRCRIAATTKENAEKVLNALDSFGFGSIGVKKEDFLKGDQIIQLGYPPNRIDILTALKEVSFKDCYKERIVIELQGEKVNFIDLENLKQNKRATGRAQDIADAEHLENGVGKKKEGAVHRLKAKRQRSRDNERSR